jgi:hypothetical protein
MRKQTVQDVILNRRFGPLEEGQRRERVEQEFGQPVGHVVGKPWYVTYGNVEVKYDDEWVSSFNLPLNEDGEINLDRYLRPGTDLLVDSFPEWCRNHSLKFIKDHYLSYGEAEQYCLSNQVSVKFLDGNLTFIAVEPADSSMFEELVNDENNKPSS